MATKNEHKSLPLSSQRPTKRRRKNSRSNAITEDKSTTFKNLPEELILGILDHLPGLDPDYPLDVGPETLDSYNKFQLPTLLALSLVSKPLHRIVSERIYKTFDSKFGEPYLYLRTIISNPNLGQSVRNVHSRYLEDAPSYYTPTAKDTKIIRCVLQKLQVPRWWTWATQCNSFPTHRHVKLNRHNIRSKTWLENLIDNETKLEALYTAIMLRAPHLTRLNYTHLGTRWTEVLKRSTSRDDFGRAHLFEFLEEVRVDSHMKLMKIASLFQKRTLQRLSLQSIHETRSLENSTWLPDLERAILSACNNIMYMDMRECELSPDDLFLVSDSVQDLDSFQYQFSTDMLEHDWGPTFLETLTGHRNSLEYLSIVNFDEYLEEHGTFNALYLKGGLRSFVALRAITCPLNSLVDMRPGASTVIANQLPPYLELLSIVIRNDTDEKNYIKAIESTQ